MAGKIIEIIVLLAGLLITAAIVISIPLKSYNEYKDYLAQIEEQNEANKQAAIKPQVESLTVELKEGVCYFANDLADPKVEHFTVVANYVKGEQKYSEPVEEGKFDIDVPADFYVKGGEIKISYKNVSATVKVELEPVVVEALEILDKPYTIKYAQGSTFDTEGMVIQAVYNDGSTKIISADEYVVDTQTALTTDDKKVTVSYQVGEIMKTVDVEVSVTETLDNGAVQSIAISNAIVNAGETLKQSTMTVIAVYESGNKKALSADEYTIDASSDAVKFGKAYELTVSYNEDTSKKAKTNVIVRQTLQGESGVIVGGKQNSEPEYVVIDGVITKTGSNVSFAGGFDDSAINGDEASITLSLYSDASAIGDITMRCSNSYCCFANGVDKSGGYMMMPLQINTILDLTVNGKEVKIPASVILKGCGPDADYAPLFGIYYEFTFENVELDPGENIIKFNFKKSTVGAVNCWGKSLCTLNIDYVKFDTLGSEIPETYEIEKLEIKDSLKIDFKQPIDSLDVPVIGTITGGAKIGVTPDLYDVNIRGVEEGDTYFHFRTYTIEVSLKTNPAVKASAEYTVEVFKSFTVLNSYVELVDGKVYYVFTGTSTGYDAEDFVIFDGSVKLPLDATFTEDTFVFKCDVTDRAAGTTFYPHIKIEGANYVNGSNSNGDILGNGLTFTDGQSVVLNGKKYSIKKQYSMPTLVVSEAPAYTAVKDNSYESDKTLLGEYKWGSEGLTVVGGSKSNESEYTNGIGGLDKANYSVTYTVTIDADGKVDFIWNIAGNKWNSTTKSNDGITNMASYMVVTIDGKAVEIGGIELRAGDGTNTSVWWNLQQIVIKDVELAAGEHTFKCVITTDGAGINAGPMEIYYAAN